MTTPNPGLSIVLPCYNPSDRWTEHLINCSGLIHEQLPDINIEWILSNDGSVKNFRKEDEAHLRASIPGLIVVHLPVNSGKGAALRAGVRVAKSPYCIFTDYDFPFGTNSLIAIFKKLESGVDVVMAVREPAYFRILPLPRRLISRITLAMNRYILRLPQPDTQAGLKGFSQRGKEIFLQTRISGFLYDTEFITKAFRSNSCRIETISVLPAPGVKFSVIRKKILLRELMNFIKIWFRC
jgi:glycosyltransferase involved in cell wall biosynthesis